MTSAPTARPTFAQVMMELSGLEMRLKKAVEELEDRAHAEHQELGTDDD